MEAGHVGDREAGGLRVRGEMLRERLDDPAVAGDRERAPPALDAEMLLERVDEARHAVG